MVKEIVLHSKKFGNRTVFVDDEDYHKLSSFHWVLAISGEKEYAQRSALSGKRGGPKNYMHREIMGFPENEVDHKDGNGLNNIRENLRVATSTQNKVNSRIRNDNTSGYKGVVWHKASGKWMARTAEKYLGLFTDKIEAAKAYNRAVIELFGEFARPNFSVIERI